MPKENPDAEASLRKLGQRLREGWTKTHPITEKSVETVKNAVRDQWEREQTGKQSKPTPGRTKTRERESEEPDQDR